MKQVTASQRPLAYKRIGKREELELAGQVPKNGGLKGKAFSHLLEKVPGHPEAGYDYLVRRAREHISLRERRMETTSVLRITAIEGRIIEVEVRLFDRSHKLRAIARWKDGENISLTRID